LDPPPTLTAFDIVFSSWGAIGWIGDLSRWMRTAIQALRPNGRLLLVEGHPVMDIFDDHALPDSPFVVRYPYESSEPLVENIQGSYAVPGAALRSPRTVYFTHSVSRILNAAVHAGFGIQKFEELDRVPWLALPQLVRTDDFYWTVPRGLPPIPLAFALEAKKL
jgi:SAM-dependent methyltransferase